MALVVQKYGGTSVGDIERIRNVATRVTATKNQGHQVVVVVSAKEGAAPKGSNKIVFTVRAEGGESVGVQEKSTFFMP